MGAVIGHAQAIVKRYQHNLWVSLESQDISSNTSTVSFTYQITHTGRMVDGSWNFNGIGFAAYINGVAHTNTVAFDFRRQATYTVVTGRQTIQHAADGTLRIPIRLVGSANPGSSWFLAADASAEAFFPTLPRASSFTVTPNSIVLGDSATINITRATTAFTHDVTWSSGTQSGTIATGVATSVQWTPPASLLATTNRVAITIRVTTKSGATVIGAPALRDITFKAPPIYPEVGAGTPFDIRLRRVVVEGGKLVPKEEIKYLSVTTTDTLSASASCTVTLSRKVYGTRLEEAVILADMYDGSQWIDAGLLFVMSRTEDDSADMSETVTYTGMSYMDWLLSKVMVVNDFEHPPVTPGDIINYYTVVGRQRGWGTHTSNSFSATATSANTPWQSAETIKVTGSSPVSQILEGYVSDSLAEYRSHFDLATGKAVLDMYNPGYGQDWAVVGADPLVNLELAGLNKVVDRAPVRKDAAEKLTRVYVKGDEGSLTREASATVAPIFGHLEGNAAASGVTDTNRLAQLGDALLTMNRTATVERTFSYDLSSTQTPTQLFPYRTFRPGDWILVPGDDGPIRARVAQVAITRNSDGTKATITTGDLIPSGLAATARKIAQAGGGAIPGGTLLAPLPLSSAIPSAPQNIVEVLDGYWDATGAPKSGVALSWTPVATSMQGSPIVVDLYEVWSRPEEGTPFTLAALTDLPEATIAPLEINAMWDFKIRARSLAGLYGEYSDVISVVTVPPDETLPAPSAPIVTVDGFGTISVAWNGLLGGTTPPRWMNYVQAEISSSETGGFSVAGQQLVSAGSITVPDAGEGVWWFRLVGYDTLDVRGAESAAISVEVVLPAIDARVPKAPTNFDVMTTAFWQGLVPMAGAGYTWDAVTEATNDTPIDVIAYEVWGRPGAGDWAAVTTSQGTAVAWSPFTPGSEWTFAVRAQGGGGLWGEFSNEITVTMPMPAFELTPPTKPILSSDKGIITARWDGLLTGTPPVAPPTSFMQVDVQMSSDNGATYVPVGTIVRGGDRVMVAGETIGASRLFRFRAVDHIGRVTMPSDSETVVVVGITVGDLDESIQDAIDNAQNTADQALDDAANAQTTADGRNRVYRQVIEPDNADLVAGDMWFEEDAEGTIIGVNVHNGVDWNAMRLVADSVLVPGSAGAISIGDGTITAPKIVASEELWAKVIGAHRIEANEIAAGAIEVQHIANGVGAQLDLSENAVIITASEQIANVSTSVDAVADSLAITQTSFSVRPDGVYVTRPGTPTQFVITNEGAEIRESGSAVSRWRSGQMQVRDVVLERLIYSTHLFESTPAGVVVRGAE